jgi:hypothetical protein
VDRLRAGAAPPELSTGPKRQLRQRHPPHRHRRTFSNSVTGASIQYKSRGIEHDSLAIPGDFNSTFTALTTGEMNVVVPGSGAVWQATGRVIDTFYPNGDETLDFYGQHDPALYYLLGETSVADELCTALGV